MKKATSLLLSILMLICATLGTSIASYAGTVYEIESNDTLYSADSFDIGDRVSGVINDDDTDFYKFTITSQKKVYLLLTSNDLTESQYYNASFYMTLWDSYDNNYTYNVNGYCFYDGNRGQVRQLDTFSLSPGTYYIRVELSGRYNAGYTIQTCFEGWNTIDGIKCYVKNGRKVTGEQKIGSKYYIFNKSNGAMCTGEVRCNGKYYIMSKSTGEMLFGKVRNNGKYYITSKSTGQMLFGRVICDGRTYICSKSTGQIFMNEYVTCNGVWYYCNSYGVATRI